MRANAIKKSHNINHDDETTGSRLVKDFPTVTVEKQPFIHEKDIEASFITSLHIMTLRDGELIGYPCHTYVMPEDKETLEDACKAFLPYAYFVPSNVYDEIKCPIVFAFDEKNQTLNLMVHEFSGLRTIAYTSSIQRQRVYDNRYNLILDKDETIRLFGIAKAYYKRVEDLNQLDWSRDVEEKDYAFKAIARFILGHTPEENEINSIFECADNLESLAHDLRELAESMCDYRMDEIPCEDEEDDDEEVAE